MTKEQCRRSAIRRRSTSPGSASDRSTSAWPPCWRPCRGCAARFFERRPAFSWHRGMMLPGSRMQTSYLKDLVTPVDPTSPFSFLSYLVAKGRFYRFLNAEFSRVRRVEFADYMRWTAEQLPNLAFGRETSDISFDGNKFVLAFGRGPAVAARNLVVATGLEPHVPTWAQRYLGADCLHSHAYLSSDLPLGEGRRVAVVGGGQSGAEIFLHLLSGRAGPCPAGRLDHPPPQPGSARRDAPSPTNISRPTTCGRFHALPESRKEPMVRAQKLAGDGVSPQTLAELSQRLYELDFLDRERGGYTIAPYREVRLLTRESVGFALHAHNAFDGRDEVVAADAVVFATGYRYATPSCLRGLAHLIARDAQGAPLLSAGLRRPLGRAPRQPHLHAERRPPHPRHRRRPAQPGRLAGGGDRQQRGRHPDLPDRSPARAAALGRASARWAPRPRSPRPADRRARAPTTRNEGARRSLGLALTWARRGWLRAPRSRAAAGERPQIRAVRMAAPPAARWPPRRSGLGRACRPPAGSGSASRREAAPASEDTCVAVAFDADNLYVGVRARDREPGAVIGRIRRRDRVIEADEEGYDWGDDDAVAVAVDTFHDGRNAFVFATNPEGAEFDALVSEESPILNHAWRTTWTVRRGPGGRGLVGRARHPLAQPPLPGRRGRPLRLRRVSPAAPAPRGVGAQRLAARPGRTAPGERLRDPRGARGPPPPAAQPRGHPLPRARGRAGRRRGRPGGQRPALAGRPRRQVGGAPGPGYRRDIRPDFSQIELDPLDLSLDPYPLFFSEKRPFFLENAGIFTLGTQGHDESPPFLMFFSRRIGYGAERLLPVDGGLRLTGRAGRNVIGLLDVLAEAEAPAEPVGLDDGGPERPPVSLLANHAALRYKRELGASAYAGAMLTDVRALTCRSPDGCPGAPSQTALGVDGAVWTTPTLRLSGFYARTGCSPGPGGFGGDAHRLAGDFDDGTHTWSVELLGIGAEADPALGFVARPGIRRSGLRAGRVLRTGALGLREIELHVASTYVTRPDPRRST